jgi:hypothetical protein
MTKINFAVLVALVTLVSLTTAFAQERTPLSVTEAVTVKATIEEINKTDR